MLKIGLTQVYTTYSDETNFAPIGLCLRAAGHNFRSLITCFSSHELMQGCPTASSLLTPLLEIDHPLGPHNGEKPIDSVIASKAFEKSRLAVLQSRYDIVVLNGIHVLLESGVLNLEELIELCVKKPSRVELIITGSRLPKKLEEIADLVTQMDVTRRADYTLEKSSSKRKGHVEVITGNGKGKTTYCLGKAMLASCSGIPSFFLQVIKSPKAYGEVMAIERLPNLTIKTMGKGFLKKEGRTFEKKHIEAAKKAWEVWLHEIYSSHYSLLVLDEINVATHYGLIRSQRVEEMLFLKPSHLHILLSGRNAHPGILQMATTVIEMREIKHPFRKGIKARKGIEF